MADRAYESQRLQSVQRASKVAALKAAAGWAVKIRSTLRISAFFGNDCTDGESNPRKGFNPTPARGCSGIHGKPGRPTCCGGMMRRLNAVVAEVLRVFFGLKSPIKSMVSFVLSMVVAYRLLDAGMDLGAEGAVAFWFVAATMKLGRSQHQESFIGTSEGEYLKCRQISRAAKRSFFLPGSHWEASLGALRWRQNRSR